MKHKILLILVVIALLLIPLSCTQPVQGPQDWDVANEDEFLAKCEHCDIVFRIYEGGNVIVYWHQRMIGNATVLGDILNYQFDKETGELKKKTVHWRDDLPDTLPEIISEEEAMTIGGGTRAELMYIDPECELLSSIQPTPKDPCWFVSVYDDEGWNIDVVVISAVSGEILGHSIPVA